MQQCDYVREALLETDAARAGVAAMMAGVGFAERGQPESRCPFGQDLPMLRDRWLEGHRMFLNVMAAKASAPTLPMVRRGHADFSSEEFREARL